MIEGRKAIEAVAQALESLGFYRVHRSRNGTSYLRLPRIPFRVRLSDHDHPSPYCDVLHSRVIERIAGSEEAHLLAAEIGVAFTATMRLRVGIVRG